MFEKSVFVRLFDYFFTLAVFIGLLISTPQSSSPETLLVADKIALSITF